MHPPEPLERTGIIRDLGDRTVRHALDVGDLGTRNVDKAPRVRVGLAGRRVPGIDDGNAVDVEIIAVSTGPNRSDRHFPHSVLSFCHLDAPAVLGDVAARKADVLGFWCMNAEGDLALGRHLGRDKLRRSWTAAFLCRCQGRHRQ